MKNRKLPPDLPQRLLAANRALECFAEVTTISHLATAPGAGFYVHWRPRGTGFPETRRWMTTRGQDFYPPWHRKWGHGGTATIALSQLIRWCQSKPILPLATWRYWMSPTCNLGRDRGRECVNALSAADYPETANCVLCERPITAGMDWWSLNGVSGPCCGMRSGCKQQGKAARDAAERVAADEWNRAAAMMDGAA